MLSLGVKAPWIPACAGMTEVLKGLLGESAGVRGKKHSHAELDSAPAGIV